VVEQPCLANSDGRLELQFVSRLVSRAGADLPNSGPPSSSERVPTGHQAGRGSVLVLGGGGDRHGSGPPALQAEREGGDDHGGDQAERNGRGDQPADRNRGEDGGGA